MFLFQGGPERALSCKQKLVKDEAGFTPLYQAAMCLMEEVRIHTLSMQYFKDLFLVLYGNGC